MQGIKQLTGGMLAMLLGLGNVAEAQAETAAIMVFDASGSMWNQMEGETTRIEIAREVMDEYFSKRDAAEPIGVIAYGHRKRGDCEDIETVAALGRHDPQELSRHIRTLNPQGMTPLTASMRMAFEQIPRTAEAADIILVTDGLENCSGDPCELAREMSASGINLRAHVVGFGMTEEEIGSLSCVAEETGGQLFQTNSGDELAAALSAVSEPVANIVLEGVDANTGNRMAGVIWQVTALGDASSSEHQASGLSTSLTLEPGEYSVQARSGLFRGEAGFSVEQDGVQQLRVELREDLPEVDLGAPDSVVVGEEFTVTWSPNHHERDFITVVPLGADEGERNQWQRIRNNSSDTLRAPGEPGQYEVRYVTDEGRRTLASHTFEAVASSLTISGPESAVAGSSFDLEWSESINRRDMVAIVPAGADEGERGTWTRVGSAMSTSLVAPAETGMYELRYILDEGRSTQARAAIEVTAPVVDISGPQSAVAGSSFDLEWSESINRRDMVAIVPAGADEGERGTWTRVGSATSTSLVAPAETGMYELRYILDEGRSTQARAAIEVTAPVVDISGPESAVAGASFDLEWSESINRRDMVAIVPAGADEGERGTWTRVGSATATNLVAPAEPGMYELRYILDKGRSTVASAPVEVVAAEVSLVAPDVVRQGEPMRVSWSTIIHRRDYVVIVPLGADEGTRPSDYWRRVASTNQHDFAAPQQEGLYEVRYVLNEGGKTAASTVVEIVDATAQIDSGAELKAPASGQPGDTVVVTWTGGSDGADQRIALAGAEQQDFTWIEAQATNEEGELSFVLPAESGVYEFRYLDIRAQEVLSRAIIEVE
ncbi:vWA domain-containing protein [Halopseudomonas salegens]|uniref:Ca-activated chloride channel family protein n=1 Tax=Halopseudomonas salegens TaxID=1434072 RepID=A0A1H2G0L5_9GAMM|nr:VWA domain-containing protein [Halopseudomonas salegens]SDU13126.1 Ca-activated chloride channel family protein [Halopseudomonas salegens]